MTIVFPHQFGVKIGIISSPATILFIYFQCTSVVKRFFRIWLYIPKFHSNYCFFVCVRIYMLKFEHDDLFQSMANSEDS